MKDLNYALKQLCQRNRDGSFATQANRAQILDLIANQLAELGFRCMQATSLKPKHIEALVGRWKADELTAGTIKNRMAELRWWAEKTGKANIIARTNEAYGIPDRKYVTNQSKSKELDMEQLKRITDPYTAMSLRLQAAFGLRREESIKIQPAAADRGDVLALKDTWTKGGRAREVPIRNNAQRELLEEAKALAGKGSLIPASLKYVEQLRRFEHQCVLARIHRSEAISADTRALRLRAVKRLFDYLTASGHLLLHPAEHIVEIRRKDRLPPAVLSVKQVKQLLAAPDVATPLGLRDRALLEVLYATGVRVGELEQALAADVDCAGRTLTIRHGKGARERVVPLGETAAQWVERYLTDARPTLARLRPYERALFLVRTGRPLLQFQIRGILRLYQGRCHLRKAVTPHALRHACATHLLQAGADIRLIQKLLGHARLDSTAIYTRVAPMDLKSVHARFHPMSSTDAAR